MSFEDIEYVTNVTGYSMISGAFSTNTAFYFISLQDWADREQTALELARKVNVRLQKEVQGAVAFAFGPPAIPGLGNGSGFTFMLQDKSGGSPEYLSNEARKFIAAANARPEIGNILTTYSASVPQRKLNIDKDKALKAGVSLDDLYNTIGAFLGRSYVNDFNRFGRLYKTYIMAEPEYRVNPSDVGLFFVKNNQGTKIPVSTFVNLENISGPEFTNRFNL